MGWGGGEGVVWRGRGSIPRKASVAEAEGMKGMRLGRWAEPGREGEELIGGGGAWPGLSVSL